MIGQLNGDSGNYTEPIPFGGVLRQKPTYRELDASVRLNFGATKPAYLPDGYRPHPSVAKPTSTVGGQFPVRSFSTLSTTTMDTRERADRLPWVC